MALYEVCETDGVDVWHASDGSRDFDLFTPAKALADEISGLVYTNDNHDVVYDASGTVDPELLVVFTSMCANCTHYHPPRRGVWNARCPAPGCTCSTYEPKLEKREV